MAAATRATSSGKGEPARRGTDRLAGVTHWWTTVASPRLTTWWRGLDTMTRIVVGVAVVLSAASVLNLASAGVSRLGGPARVAASMAPSVTAPPLVSEVAPSDAGKAWSVLRVWHGSGSSETEAFTVSDHWRVDWVFDPVGTGSQLQVFIYHAEGRLLMTVAANTLKAGPDSSFWLGPGKYFLKINSSGGAWKIAVQDLR